MGIFFFLGMALLPGFLIKPWFDGLWSHLFPQVKNNFIYALLWGHAVFWILFSLIARTSLPYEWCYLLSIGLLLSFLACSHFYAFKKVDASLEVLFSWKKEDTFFFLGVMVSFIFFLGVRGYYSQSMYASGEKLFNLSLLQSFSLGKEYPPLDLWFGGEPLRYYLLPKALAGVACYFWSSFFPSQNDAGLFFHLGGVWSHVLGFCGLMAGCFSLLTRFQKKKNIYFWFLFVFLFSFPYWALPGKDVQSFFWDLSRIIPDTINEFPLWTYLFADNHSHEHAISHDVFLGILFILICLYGKRMALKVESVFQAGILLLPVCLYLFMSHSWSVLAQFVLFLPLLSFCFIRYLPFYKKSYGEEVFIPLLFLSLFLFLPDLLTRSPGETTWYLVPESLRTGMRDGFIAQKGIVLFVSAFFIIFFISSLNSWRNPLFISFLFQRIKSWKIPLCFFVLAFILFLLKAPMPAFWALGSGILCLFKKSKSYSIFCLGFVLFVGVLDFVAVNFHYGDKFMRLNTVFKFGFIEFYLLPLFLATYWGSQRYKNVSLLKNIFISVAFLGVMGWQVYQSYQLFSHQKTQQIWSLDSFETLKQQNPLDFKLAEKLRNLDPALYHLEECGLHPNPTAYTELGRLAAISGHGGVCGWAQHIAFFHQKHGKEKVYDYLNRIQNQWKSLLALLEKEEISQEDLKEGLLFLKKENIHYIAWGFFEQKFNPRLSFDKIKLLGEVLWEEENYGLVKIR